MDVWVPGRHLFMPGGSKPVIDPSNQRTSLFVCLRIAVEPDRMVSTEQ